MDSMLWIMFNIIYIVALEEEEGLCNKVVPLIRLI